MKHRSCAVAVLALLAPLAGAQTASQGARELPARSVPVPETVSPQMQKLIGAPLTPTWNVIPKTAAEWKGQVNAGYEATMKSLPALREALGVKVEPIMLDGVKAYMVTPSSIPPQNRNRLLVHVHGGCFVSFPGGAACPAAASGAPPANPGRWRRSTCPGSAASGCSRSTTACRRTILIPPR